MKKDASKLLMILFIWLNAFGQLGKDMGPRHICVQSEIHLEDERDLFMVE